MPVDPNISLQIQVPQPQMAGAAMNPLGAINSLAELQLRMNQNALFQQQFQANHLMGSIMAGSPDVETGFQRILQSPAAPFAGQFLNNARSAEKTLLDMSVARSGLAKTALEGYLKNLSGALADPTMIPKLGEASLATVTDPLARSQLGSAISSLNTALVDDNVKSMAASGDPQQVSAARSLLNSRIVGLLAGNGVGADTLRALTGTPAPAMETPVGPGGQPIPGMIGTGGVLSPNPAGFTPLQLGSNALVGPSVAEKAQMESTGKQAGAFTEDLSSIAKSLPEDLNRIDVMADSLKEFRAGGGANFRANMAKVLQGFKNAGVGINQDLIDRVGNENLASSQVFDANVRPAVVRELKLAAQGTGRVMRSEVDAFLAMMDKTTDPEALRQLLNQAKYQTQVAYDQTQKFSDYKQLLARRDPSVAGLDVGDFYSWYNRGFDKSKLPKGSPTGLNFEPIPASEVKGAAPTGGAPTHRYIPGQGLVPINP